MYWRRRLRPSERGCAPDGKDERFDKRRFGACLACSRIGAIGYAIAARGDLPLALTPLVGLRDRLSDRSWRAK